MVTQRSWVRGQKRQGDGETGVASIRDRVLEIAVKTLLEYRSRPGIVERVLKGKRGSRTETSTRERVTVAAVQMEFEVLDGPAQYAEKVYTLARQAVERGAQLVVFPEYSWTPLIGMLPGIRDLSARARGGLEDAAEEMGGIKLGDIFRTVAPAMERAFIATGQGVARALGIYLMNGSTIALERDGQLMNVAYLFGPDGALLGRQPKLHPFLTERDWMTCGTQLEVLDLPFARIAMPVCMDFTYWETTRLAAQAGAEILINPAADSGGDEEYPAALGVRTRVQETNCFGILCNIVTDLFGLHWRGVSRIVAPIGFDPRGSTLARTSTCDREEIVVAELDLPGLRAWRAEHPLEFNPAIQSSLSRAYGEYTTRVRPDGRRMMN